MARLTGLAPHRIRRLARSGLLACRLDPAGRYRYSFRDIVLLRSAQKLSRDDGAGRRLWRSLRERRREAGSGQAALQLPAPREAGDDDNVAWFVRRCAKLPAARPPSCPPA